MLFLIWCLYETSDLYLTYLKCSLFILDFKDWNIVTSVLYTSVLRDSLINVKLCIPLKRGSNVPSTGSGFLCLSLPSKLKGILLSKALTCILFSCTNKNDFFIKETDTFGHIVIKTIYTSHIDHFTPQHTTLEQSPACLSVVFDLPPGFIPFAILRHAGWTLETNICMNMNYNYPTKIYKYFAWMYKFLVENIFLQFWLMNFSWLNQKLQLIPEINSFGSKYFYTL